MADQSDVSTFFPPLSLHTDGGVGIGTEFPEADLDVHDFDGNGFAAFRLTRDGRSWAMSHPPAGVFTFNLIGSGGQEFAVRERLDAVGPVAEDFQRLFGLGDGTTIASIDADGVLMAAVQRLKQLLELKEAEIAEVKQTNLELQARLSAVETRLAMPDP